MAATTKLLQLRAKLNPITANPASIFFSSSAVPDPSHHSPESSSVSSPPQSQSPFSSYLADLKGSLKQSPSPSRRDPQSQPSRRPSNFMSSSSPNSSKSTDSMEEIRKNLSSFRQRTEVSPPSPSASTPPSSQQLSFQDLYQKNLLSKDEGSAPDPLISAGKFRFGDIREKLINNLTPSNQNVRGRSLNDSFLNSNFKEGLNTRSVVFGGSDNLPPTVFGKELDEEKVVKDNNEELETQFVKQYSFEELGAKLKSLRLEKKGNQKEMFSLEELNGRLRKLRKMEEEVSRANKTFTALRAGLVTIKSADEQKNRTTMQSATILSQLGKTPSFALLPPQEELVEKYFHPDNMSASEKMKLELEKIRDEFKMSESDCGSARVQVAQLTTKIKHLSTVLHKKDKHSRKGLLAMVQRRKKLLKYLRRTDWDSFCLVLEKLGLRDNPVYKKDYPENKKKKKQPKLKH